MPYFLVMFLITYAFICLLFGDRILSIFIFVFGIVFVYDLYSFRPLAVVLTRALELLCLKRKIRDIARTLTWYVAHVNFYPH